jgi:predicted nucleotidyltransferase
VLSAEVIRQAGRRLADAAAAPTQVFVFGSHARGDAGHGSDLDFLVVERGVQPSAEDQRDVAALPLRKAEGDVEVVRALVGNASITDDAIGWARGVLADGE